MIAGLWAAAAFVVMTSPGSWAKQVGHGLVPARAGGTPAMSVARAEALVWTRIAEHLQHGGTLVPTRFLVSIPIGGVGVDIEPASIDSASAATADELWGGLIDSASASAARAWVVAAALLGDVDSTGSVARYRVRLESRTGRCLEVSQRVQIGDDGVVRARDRVAKSCAPLMMAEVIHRARRLARLPLQAGDLGDDWAVRAVATGHVDVYADSVVVQLSALQLRTSPSQGSPCLVDSVSIGLALGRGRSWSVARQSAAWPVNRELAPGREWRRTGLRFVVAVDSTFPLKDAWPVVQGHLHAERTPANPYGLAWVYAHAPEGYFASVPRGGSP